MVSCMKLVIFLLYNNLFIYQVLCTLIYRRRSLYSFLSALGAFQHIMSQVLEGCEGAHNISDDIIIAGNGQEDHDKRLEAVLTHLE